MAVGRPSFRHPSVPARISTGSHTAPLWSAHLQVARLPIGGITAPPRRASTANGASASSTPRCPPARTRRAGASGPCTAGPTAATPRRSSDTGRRRSRRPTRGESEVASAIDQPRCHPRALSGWSPPSLPADTTLKYRVDRLLVGGAPALGVLVLVIALLNLAPYVPVRAQGRFRCLIRLLPRRFSATSTSLVGQPSRGFEPGEDQRGPAVRRLLRPSARSRCPISSCCRHEANQQNGSGGVAPLISPGRRGPSEREVPRQPRRGQICGLPYIHALSRSVREPLGPSPYPVCTLIHRILGLAGRHDSMHRRAASPLLVSFSARGEGRGSRPDITPCQRPRTS